MRTKKKYIFLIVIICIIGYFYFSYAHIYNKIKSMSLPSPQNEKQYTINNKNTKSITYVALGDSLTAGVGVDNYMYSYPYVISEKMAENQNVSVELIPVAIPGARTRDMTDEKILNQIIQNRPDIITILLGVNDIHGKISSEDFYKNYSKILDRLTTETQAIVYVIEIPYIGHSTLILPLYDLFFDTKTKEFNAILKNLQEKYPIRIISLYSDTRQNAEERAYYSADLFHPGQMGYTLWAQIIYNAFNN